MSDDTIRSDPATLPPSCGASQQSHAQLCIRMRFEARRCILVRRERSATSITGHVSWHPLGGSFDFVVLDANGR